MVKLFSWSDFLERSDLLIWIEIPYIFEGELFYFEKVYYVKGLLFSNMMHVSKEADRSQMYKKGFNWFRFLTAPQVRPEDGRGVNNISRLLTIYFPRRSDLHELARCKRRSNSSKHMAIQLAAKVSAVAGGYILWIYSFGKRHW